ncbi:MAG: PilZ domain-containing protein [Desulfosoma sp.]|uniref:PilZ domain-containing protein n=1 Tax=Desulfosoma sp. TaxID=2603217 RepID=UPI00404A2312
MTNKENLLEELKDLEETLELTGVFDDQAVVRKTFRVPVNEQTPVTFLINGVSFRVANISEGGMGFLAESGDVAEVGQSLEGLELHFGGRCLQAKGTVRHVTPLEDSGFLYGLSLDLSSEDDRTFMVDFVQRARERFFEQH